jgi:hypothetical protein
MADKQISDLTAVTPPVTNAALAHIKEGSNSRKATMAQMGASKVLLSAQVASASATIDFTSISSTFDEYEIHFDGVVPQTDTAVLWLRTSTDGGANYDTANNYRWAVIAHSSAGGTVADLESNSDSKISSIISFGSSTGESASGVIRLSGLNSSSLYKLVKLDVVSYQSTPVVQFVIGGGVYVNASVVNGVRLLMSTGNIASGNFYLYGIRKG